MTLPIIPRPVSCRVNSGKFILDQSTVVSGGDEFIKHVQDAFCSPTGFPISAGQGTTKNTIRGILELHRFTVAGSYTLKVEPNAVEIVAGETSGLFYGIQTLRQLFPVEIFNRAANAGATWSVPCVEVDDTPRFGWRGIMLDCSRHFFDADYIKSFIDNLALHKFNIFHWHLTDDQGWRIEIKKYPKLTEVGGWRDETIVGHASDLPVRFDGIRYGGFYSQAQIREIVAYARDRHVTIVPEIELPGHSRAAIAAYPELGNGIHPPSVATIWGVDDQILNAEEATFRFYEDVLSEVIELFPSQFIHIGGDEAVKDEWNASPRIQQRIRDLGLHSEHDLQAYFIMRMDRFLAERGRRLIGWDEILEGKLAPGATVMSWRGDAGAVAAAELGHDSVMASTEYAYLDYYQSLEKSSVPQALHGYIPLEKAYAFQIIPEKLTPEQARHVLGGQAQLWTEYMPTIERLNYMMYPRAIAIAEALWTEPSMRSYPDFLERLPYHMRALVARGVRGRPLST